MEFFLLMTITDFFGCFTIKKRGEARSSPQKKMESDSAESSWYHCSTVSLILSFNVIKGSFDDSIQLHYFCILSLPLHSGMVRPSQIKTTLPWTTHERVMEVGCGSLKRIWQVAKTQWGCVVVPAWIDLRWVNKSLDGCVSLLKGVSLSFIATLAFLSAFDRSHPFEPR